MAGTRISCVNTVTENFTSPLKKFSNQTQFVSHPIYFHLRYTDRGTKFLKYSIQSYLALDKWTVFVR